MPDLTSTLQALQAHAWYPAAAGIVTLLLALFRRVAPETWARLPRRWQWVPAVLLAALGAFVDAYASGVSWRIALVLTGYGAVTAGLGAIGLLHTAKRMADKPPPSDEVPVTVEDSTVPSTLRTGATLLVLMVLGAVGCSGGVPETCQPDTDLATIEAAYVAETVATCRQYTTPDDCPQYPAIREKYRVQRAAWVSCQGRL
jgi:hypothetical protein